MSYLENRIQSFQKECVTLDSSLHVLHTELSASPEVSKAELGYIVDCAEYVQKLYDGVNSDNISKYEKELIELERELKYQYGKGLIETVYTVPSERTSRVKTRKAEKKDTRNLYAAGVLSGAILMGLVGAAIYGDRKNNEETVTRASSLEVVSTTENNVNEQDETIVVATQDNGEELVATVLPTPEPTPAPVVTPVPTVEPTPVVVETTPVVTLALGEPGTFLDITDDEQVVARAQYIYDNYFAPYMDKVSADERAHTTVDRIADAIRVMNGRCPLDENGYKLRDANTTDTYAQAFVDLYANVPSSDVMGTVELVPAHLFAIDGSEVQAFLRTYDELYGRIAEGRNTRNSDMYRGAAEILEAKMWYEWHCQGMGGYILFNTETHEIDTENNIRYNEVTGNWERLCPEDNTYKVLTNTEVYPVMNPYNIDATYRYLAYAGTMYRFGSYIEEAEHNQMAPICVPLCVDFATKELNEYTIDEVYTGINEGLWNNIIAQHAGMADQVPGVPVSVGFWQALDNQLEYDYTHSSALGLK